MLTAIMACAHQNGWFDTQRPYERSIYLSRGASLWMILSRQGRPDTFLKFSHLVDLQPEALRFRDAFSAYPDHAPPFVGHALHEGLSLMATRAVDFKAVTAAIWLNRRDTACVRSGLDRFFEAAGRTASHSGSAPVRASLDALRAHYETHPLAGIALPALDAANDCLLALPPIAQHGDLVMNNLGIRDDGRLVVFDWEDYGALWLPGLDLFTLGYAFDEQIRVVMGDRLPDWALPSETMLAAVGLDEETLERLWLVHALGFLYLKRNYGPDIQAQLARMIREGSAGQNRLPRARRPS